MEPLFVVLRYFLGFILVVSGVVTWVSGAIALWVRRKEKGLQAIGIPLALWTLFKEWIATAILFLLYPLGFLPFREQVDPDDPHPPVLFIHGYSMNRATWLVFRWRMRRQGYRNLFSLNLPLFASIARDAEIVAEKLERLKTKLPERRWVLLGHSMGGLVIRAYMKKYGSEGILRAYTLGTPHEGTLMARLGQGRNAREMEPGSPFLRELAQEEPDTAKILCIASRLDNLVVPWRNALHPRAPSLILAEPIGHNHLVLHPRVARAVLADLKFFEGRS